MRSAPLRFILRHWGVLFVRRIPQDSRALHLIVFDQPAQNGVYQRPGKRLPVFPAFDVDL